VVLNAALSGPLGRWGRGALRFVRSRAIETMPDLPKGSTR
jgi:hypothetical protein